MLRQILVFILTGCFFIFAYVKYYERKGIYYPTKEITLTPISVGLDYEEVWFKTSDGIEINAWFIPQEKAQGTLLYCHGNAGNLSHRVEISKIFHQLNLNVFIFDYRGYGKSQGRPSEAGLYQDALAAYSYLLERKDINQEAIVIYGKSIGANVAINLASQVKAKALIAESGFTSAADMGRRMLPFLPVKWLISIKYDAVTKIKNISTPKLIIHSRDDEVIPFELGKQLFLAAAKPKEFYPMRGSHNQAIFVCEQEYRTKIASFLDKYLVK